MPAAIRRLTGDDALEDLLVASMSWRDDGAIDPSRIRTDPAVAHDLSGRDPLHDEGATLAEHLGAAGRPVRMLSLQGMVHGFLTLDTVPEAARSRGDEVTMTFGRALAERGAGL